MIILDLFYNNNISNVKDSVNNYINSGSSFTSVIGRIKTAINFLDSNFDFINRKVERKYPRINSLVEDVIYYLTKEVFVC